MIVHFIGSKGSIKQEIAYYRSIVKILKGKGHSLALDWVEDIFLAAGKGDFDESGVDWTKLDQENSAAISKADVVIVEATRKSFFVGYQVAQAVSQKKPILILVRDNSFPGLESLSTVSDIISKGSYRDVNELESVIDRFIQENTIDTKDMRFNFFIDRSIYNYLRWAAYKTGKTKAEILRELVNKEISKANDQNRL